MLIGGVAQLAEHRVCNAGVRGSNPLASTKFSSDLEGAKIFARRATEKASEVSKVDAHKSVGRQAARS